MEKNPQNKRILKEYKDYLTDEEKDALKKDSLVSPRYRTAKPVGKNSRGEPFYDYSYAPEFKKSSMNRSSESYDAGAGRGKVNPESVQKNKTGGKVKGYAPSGSTGKSPEIKNMPDTRPVPKDAKFGDRGASNRKSPEMKTMPNNRPPVEGSKFGDQDAPKRKSPYMVKLAGGGSVTRGDGIAKRGHTKGKMV